MAGLGAKTLRNSLWNIVGFGVSIVLGFFLSPFVVHRIGLEMFGLYGLVTVVLAPLTLANLGFGEATVRYVANHAERGEWDQVGRYVQTTLFMNLAVGVGGMLLLIVAGPSAVMHFFDVPIAQAGIVRACVRIAGVGWLFSQIGSVFSAVPPALQNYKHSALGGTIVTLTGYALSFGFVGLGGGIVGYTWATAANAGLTAAYWLVVTRRLVPKISLWPKLDRTVWKSSFRFGSWQALAQLAGIGANQGERFVLGAMLPPAAVGIYNLAFGLEQRVYSAVWKLAEVLFPTFSAISDASAERKANLLLRSSWLLTTLAVCGLTPLIPIAHDLLSLWISPDVGERGAFLLQVIAVAGAVGCGTNASYFFLLGSGKTKAISVISITTGVVTVAVALVSIRLLGLRGAGFAPLAGALAQMFTLAFVLRQTLGSEITWREVTSHNVSIAIGIAVGVAFTGLTGALHSWFSLVAVYLGLAGLTFVACAVATVLLPRGGAHRADLRFLVQRVLAILGRGRVDAVPG